MIIVGQLTQWRGCWCYTPPPGSVVGNLNIGEYTYNNLPWTHKHRSCLCTCSVTSPPLPNLFILSLSSHQSLANNVEPSACCRCHHPHHYRNPWLLYHDRDSADECSCCHADVLSTGPSLLSHRLNRCTSVPIQYPPNSIHRNLLVPDQHIVELKCRFRYFLRTFWPCTSFITRHGYAHCSGTRWLISSIDQ